MGSRTRATSPRAEQVLNACRQAMTLKHYPEGLIEGALAMALAHAEYRVSPVRPPHYDDALADVLQAETSTVETWIIKSMNY